VTMDTRRLDETIRSVLSGDRGLLAMDESTPTSNRRFAALGIAQTVEMRRAYRDMIVTTPRLGESIGGAILYDETIRQRTNAGVPFAEALQQAGIVAGIKVDAGSKPLAGFADEEVTEGLDRLRERLAEYAGMGARFAKWRAVIRIGDATPSHGGLLANAHALARYAALCQEAGLVPIVEPEVLMDGDHTLQRCREVTEHTLEVVFAQLCAQRVRLEGMLLKPNMVLPGEACAAQSDTASIAAATVETLLRCVPAAVPGIAFLSGGQAPRLASERLNAMNATYGERLPWALTFSFARAIQEPAMETWHGDPANVSAAQQALAHRAACNRAARRGRYDAARDAPAAS
jgi:fructose-bisphosphate aldolase, class I